MNQSLYLIPLSLLIAAPSFAGDGLCTAEEQTDGLCFVSPGGFVVEALTGTNGEFPVIDDMGNSVFAYQITGPGANGGSCAGVHDISHGDILVPNCDNGTLHILDSSPNGERLSNGHGDPSCGFGTGDLGHDVFKWDHGVSCNGSEIFYVVLAGQVSAAPTSFLLKAATDCDVATILGPDCANPFVYCVGNPNSVGDGGHIGSTGSISIADNNFRLSGTGLPPNQPGYFFFGTEQNNLPFGDGVRCIGGDVGRLRKIAIEVTGTTFLQFDFTVSPFDTIQPGIPYYFQLYYRDPAAGASGFNTTDALCVTFAP